MPPKSSFIYILCHPITGELRYVGKANNPRQRLSSHLGSNHKVPVSNWIRSLKSKGLLPVMEVIEETDDWMTAERFWICHLRFLGFRLLNLTEGGDQYATKEHIERLAAMKRGKKQSPEHLAKRMKILRFDDSERQRQRILKRWGENTVASRKPWLEMGISRRAWYYRKKKAEMDKCSE